MQKVKEILAEGKIGKVISSTVTACTSVLPVDAWLKGVEFYLDFKSGGNEYTVFVGHCMFILSLSQIWLILSIQFLTASLTSLATSRQSMVSLHPNTRLSLSLTSPQARSTIQRIQKRHLITPTSSARLNPLLLHQSRSARPSRQLTRSVSAGTSQALMVRLSSQLKRETGSMGALLSRGNLCLRWGKMTP